MATNAAAQARVSGGASSFARRTFWAIFALLTLSALISSSLPILLNPENPLHPILSAQRWLLLPHMIGGITFLVLGPFQFSTRLRQRNPARHRLLGKISIVCALTSAVFAPIMAWHYPAFFPYSVLTNATIWIVCTLAAFIMARNRQFESHRRWMARSYAVAATFVLPRVPVPIPALQHMSLEAGSYALLIYTLFALLIAELMVDFNLRKRSANTVASA